VRGLEQITQLAIVAFIVINMERRLKAAIRIVLGLSNSFVCPLAHTGFVFSRRGSHQLNAAPSINHRY